MVRLFSFAIFVSSVVFFEPAPFDLLALILIFFMGVGKGTFRSVLVVLVLFNVSSFVSVFSAFDYELALVHVIITFYLSCFVLAAAGVQFDHGLLRMAFRGNALLLSVGFFLSLFAILTGFQEEVFARLQGRFNGFFKDPNVFGPAASAAFFWLLSLEKSKPVKWFFGLILALSVVLSGSRVAIVGFVICNYVYWGGVEYYSRRLPSVSGLSKFGYFILAAPVLIIPFVPIVVVVLEDSWLFNDFLSLGSRMEIKDYDDTRFDNWSYMLTLFGDNYFGIGANNSILFVQNTHNTFLQVLVERGVLTFIFFLYLIFVAVSASLDCIKKGVEFGSRYSNTGGVLELGLACFVVFLHTIGSMFVVDTLHWRHFWIAFALVMVLKNANQDTISLGRLS